MEIRPIRNDADHAAALKQIEQLWDAPDRSKEADALDVLTVLVEDYENARWPIEPLDPISSIRAHIEATGRSQSDLASVIGSRSRASEVMARKRALTIGMIRSLASQWNLPAELLLAPYKLKRVASKQTVTKKSHPRDRRRHKQW